MIKTFTFIFPRQKSYELHIIWSNIAQILFFRSISDVLVKYYYIPNYCLGPFTIFGSMPLSACCINHVCKILSFDHVEFYNVSIFI